ncbi:hypothetical protein EXS45_00565 [Candidatus Nomurabacteria bacterium]|nr:hypothetical protein [Candidatus Nomurabacteria bacterium]
MRKTNIIVTLGPASYDPEVVRGMISAGADVFRLNLSHVNSSDDYPFLVGVVKMVRRIAGEQGKTIEIMVDCPGHKFRLGHFVARKVRLGGLLELTVNQMPQNGEISFPYPNFMSLLEQGQEVVIGDGVPRFEVVRIASQESPNVLCKVTLPGLLEPRKGFTVLGFKIANLLLPHLTEADKRGLEFAIEVKAEQVVMSYGTTVVQLNAFNVHYSELGVMGKVLFKYELGEAWSDIDDIVNASDGGFVGQGDLGLSVPSEYVPHEAMRVISAYIAKGKPCIVGTQLLASMKNHLFSTHGESAGIYLYVLKGATGLMVSDETSVGAHPIEVVKTLDLLIRAAEVQ